jgi:hypothetical protein
VRVWQLDLQLSRDGMHLRANCIFAPAVLINTGDLLLVDEPSRLGAVVSVEFGPIAYGTEATPFPLCNVLEKALARIADSRVSTRIKSEDLRLPFVES